MSDEANQHDVSSPLDQEQKLSQVADEFPQWLKPGIDKRHAEHLPWTQNLMLYWYDLVLIHFYFMVGFLSKHFHYANKSLVGDAKTPVTSLLLKAIQFSAVDKLKKWWINTENFVSKCQVVIGIHYFDITVWFQCTHFWTWENRYVVMLNTL